MVASSTSVKTAIASRDDPRGRAALRGAGSDRPLHEVGVGGLEDDDVHPVLRSDVEEVDGGELVRIGEQVDLEGDDGSLVDRIHPSRTMTWSSAATMSMPKPPSKML